MTRLILTTALLPLAAQAASLDLAGALQEALGKGPDAQLLRNSADSSRSYARSVRSVAYPQVTGSAAAGLGYQANATAGMMKGIAGLLRQDTAIKGTNALIIPDDPYYSYSVGVKVAQPLITFGKVSTALRMAETYDRVTQASLLARRQSIQQNVVDAWLAAVLAQAKLEVTEKSVGRQTELVSFLERNFAMGSGQKAQVLQARSRLIQTRQGIISARSAALAAHKALNRLVSRAPDDSTPLDTAGISAFEKIRVAPREELLRNVYQNRQDLRAMQESRSLLADLTKINRAAYYPTIGLQGALGYSIASQNASGAKDMFDWSNRNWSIGVGMTWNIFDGWNGSNQTEESRSAERSMEVNIVNMRKVMEISADTYLHDKEAADSGLSAATEGVEAAREAYRLYKSNFDSGSGQLSDILSSEDDLRSAELGWLSARLDRVKACIHLTLVQGDDLIALQEVQ